MGHSKSYTALRDENATLKEKIFELEGRILQLLEANHQMNALVLGYVRKDYEQAQIAKEGEELAWEE